VAVRPLQPTAPLTGSTNNYTIGYTHTLTPSLVSDLRFGRQYSNASLVNEFYLNNIAGAGANLGIPGFNADVLYNNPGIPTLPWPVTLLFNMGTNSFVSDKTWQGSEQISWTRGAHTIMAGAEVRKLITGEQADQTEASSISRQFTGYAPGDFVLGFPQSLTTPVAEVRGVMAEWRDGFFVSTNGRFRANSPSTTASATSCPCAYSRTAAPPN